MPRVQIPILGDRSVESVWIQREYSNDWRRCRDQHTLGQMSADLDRATVRSTNSLRRRYESTVGTLWPKPQRKEILHAVSAV